MIREVLTYPNPILKKKSVDVAKFNEELHNLLDDMFETMIHNNGIGLAAVQIGALQNILIICLPNEDDEQDKAGLIEAINPKIIFKDGVQICKEGCLSVPEYYEDVKRAEHIIVEYQDRFGKMQKMEYNDFLAVVWQHEMEHLEGHLFIENLSIIKRKKFEKEWKQKLKNKS